MTRIIVAADPRPDGDQRTLTVWVDTAAGGVRPCGTLTVPARFAAEIARRLETPADPTVTVLRRWCYRRMYDPTCKRMLAVLDGKTGTG